MTTPFEDIKPPKFADHFLAWFCSGKLLEEVKGDLHESYRIERKQKGDRHSENTGRFCFRYF